MTLLVIFSSFDHLFFVFLVLFSPSFGRAWGYKCSRSPIILVQIVQNFTFTSVESILMSCEFYKKCAGNIYLRDYCVSMELSPHFITTSLMQKREIVFERSRRQSPASKRRKMYKPRSFQFSVLYCAY